MHSDAMYTHLESRKSVADTVADATIAALYTSTSDHIIVPLLRKLRPVIWARLSVEQKHIALAACDGKRDIKTLERAYRIARNS